MYISALTLCNYVHHVCAQYPSMPEEVFGSHGTAFTDSCEPPYRFWEPNPRSSIRTANTLTIKPSLQPWAHNLNINGEMVNIWFDLKTFQNLPSKLGLALHAYNPSRRLENFRLAWAKYILSQTRPGMMAHTFNLGTWEAKAAYFEDALGYIVGSRSACTK